MSRSIRTAFDEAGAKLYKLDVRKAAQEAAQFFLDVLKQGKTQAQAE